jgi:hypothetical protein
LDAGGNHGMQKVRQVVQKVRHWMLGTGGAGGETLDAGGNHGMQKVGGTGDAGGETLDAGGNHGMQKVGQVMQEVRHWMLEGNMGCRR